MNLVTIRLYSIDAITEARNNNQNIYILNGNDMVKANLSEAYDRFYSERGVYTDYNI